MTNTSEEKFPLLLYIVESTEDLSKTNKRLYFDKGRFHGITTGATAVIREFPNYIGTCWVTTALSGLLFFMLILLLLSSITTGGLRVPRCTIKEDINNNTIHLVHTHAPGEWNPVEIDLFEKIIENYPDYNIHLILIQKNMPPRKPKYERNILEEDRPPSAMSTDMQLVTTEKTILQKNEETVIVKRDTTTEKKKKKVDNLRLSINMSARRLLDILLHGKTADLQQIPGRSKNLLRTSRSTIETTERIKTVEDLLKDHPDIVVDNTTYNHVFYMSPLYAYWPFLNDKLKIFSVRVLQLWQYGGISFDLKPGLQQADDNDNNKTGEMDAGNRTSAEQDIENIYKKKLLNFIITEKKNYENLPYGVVTADDEALHMESKIPCHAFFGEIMMHLRKARDDTTVKDVLQESLKVFCKHSAANKKYCDIVTKVQ